MIKAYKVAGHVFRLELPDSSVLWEKLTQYLPFEITADSSPLFSLKLVHSLPPEPKETVYDVPPEPGEAVLRLHSTPSGYLIEMAPSDRFPVCGMLRMDRKFHEGELCLCGKTVSDAVFCINNSLMLLYAFATAKLGTLEMHASVIMNSGRGFLFLAKSGTGKSTHSSLWLKHIPGSVLLNDDNPVVRVWPDGRIIVYGTPWSGKTPCYKNLECPVGAFVRIRRCAENRITPLSVVESYALLYSSCSGLKSDPEMGDGLHESLEAAALNVPSYVLDCRPDEEAARVSSAELLKDGETDTAQ